MLRPPRLALLLPLALAPACDQTGTVFTTPLDAGGGVTALLTPAGALTVSRGGAPLIATPPGTPLVTRTADPESPDGWHDPTRPHPGLPVLPVDATTVTVTSVDDGSGTRALHLVVPAQPADTALLTVTLAAEPAASAFYTGLGEQYGHVSARGRVTPMFLTTGSLLESDTNEAHVPVPFLVSSTGWGLFVASRQAGAFDVGATDAGALRVTFEGRSLDVWLFVDPDPLAVVSRFNRLAGLPRPLPRWALSPIFWRHFASAADVLDLASGHRQRHIPTSALWFDDGWQTGFNTFTIAPGVFGDAAPMMQELAVLGFRAMAWSTPYLEEPGPAPPAGDDAPALYQQAAASHLLVEDTSHQVFLSPATPIHGGAGIVDFTSPAASAFWAGLVGRATATGIRGFKCDYGEELIPNLAGARNPVVFSDGTTAQTARGFPVQEHAAYHAALDAAFPGDGVILARASSWGGAAQADLIWPGDLDGAFERQGDPIPGSVAQSVGGLPAVVVDAQTLGVSGFPAFASDTGGYRGTPTPESLQRWMEHTALSVVMQVYEDGDTRLPWALGPSVEADYEAMTRLHQSLVPYLAGLMRAAQSRGQPAIVPLPLAFPSDPATFARADDEYLLGSDLLVAPVLEAGATAKSLHLPPGQWVHWWSDQVFSGPADVTVPAPLGQPALFARAGGLVPMLPDGVDTLVEATAPGVVTLSSVAAEVRARAWASGSAQVTLDDGGSLSVVDGPAGVTVTWLPGASGKNLVLDLDTRVRGAGKAGQGPATGVASLSGAPLTPLGSAADVAASATGAWVVVGGHATVRLVGAGSLLAR